MFRKKRILDEDAWGFWSFLAKRVVKARFRKVSQEYHKRALVSLNEREIGVYIHFPFCKSFCLYCPYFKELYNEKKFKKYWKALKKEIELVGKLFANAGIDLKITEIHVGGGTPSIAPPEFYSDVLQTLMNYFDVKTHIGIEANPNDLVDESYVCSLLEAGVKEISVGVQSFNDEMLKHLGRSHRSKHNEIALKNVINAGYDLVNVDLMFLIPGQTIDSWIQDLNKTISFSPHQITAYPTLMTDYCLAGKWIREGKITQEVEKFKDYVIITNKILTEAGYKRIRVESWSKKGDYATVNLEMEGPLFAFGPGAIGFTGAYEYVNVMSVDAYIMNIMNDTLPVFFARDVSFKERLFRILASRLFYYGILIESELEKKVKIRFSDFPMSIKMVLTFLNLLGYIKKQRGKIVTTEKAFIPMHKMTWAIVLLGPCKIVEKTLKYGDKQEITIP